MDRIGLPGPMNLRKGRQLTDTGIPWALMRDGHESVVYVRVVDDRCPDTQELQCMFRLTPTQARVARMLVVRRTNAEIAALLDLSIHTARRHVEAVLLRMDVQSRWDVEETVLLAAANEERRDVRGELAPLLRAAG